MFSYFRDKIQGLSPRKLKTPSPMKEKSISPKELKTPYPMDEKSPSPMKEESPYDYFDNFEYSERQLRNAGFGNTDLQALTICIENNASSVEDVKLAYGTKKKLSSSPLQDRIYQLILMISDIFQAMADHDNAYTDARKHKQLVARKRELQRLNNIMTDKIRNYEKELQDAILLYQTEKEEKEKTKPKKPRKTEKKAPRSPKGTCKNRAGNCSSPLTERNDL